MSNDDKNQPAEAQPVKTQCNESVSSQGVSILSKKTMVVGGRGGRRYSITFSHPAGLHTASSLGPGTASSLGPGNPGGPVTASWDQTPHSQQPLGSSLGSIYPRFGLNLSQTWDQIQLPTHSQQPASRDVGVGEEDPLQVKVVESGSVGSQCSAPRHYSMCTQTAQSLDLGIQTEQADDYFLPQQLSRSPPIDRAVEVVVEAKVVRKDEFADRDLYLSPAIGCASNCT